MPRAKSKKVANRGGKGRVRGGRFRRRRYGKVRRNRNHLSKTVIRTRNAYKDTTFVKLRYSAILTFSAGNVIEPLGISEYVFRGNSIFDPDFSGSGNQPYGFDQWTDIYSNYLVYGSKFTVEDVPYVSGNDYSSGSSDSVHQLTLYPSLTSTVTNTTYGGIQYQQLPMIPYAKNKTIVTNSSHRKDRMISHYMPTGKLEGVPTNVVSADPNYFAGAGTNPSATWYWHLLAAPMINNQAYYCYVKVNITYYVKFFARRPEIGMS